MTLLKTLFTCEKMQLWCSHCLDWGLKFVLIESRAHCVVVWPAAVTV